MVSIIQNEMLFSRRPISNHPEQSQMAMHAKYILWEICFLFPVCLVYIYYVYPYILYPFQHPFHHFAIPSSCIPKDIGGKWAECETGSSFHCMVLVRAFTSSRFTILECIYTKLLSKTPKYHVYVLSSFAVL